MGEEYAEGIIDYLRAVDGTDMAAVIREPPEPPDAKRRVSLRASHDELDVSAIARAARRRRAPPGGRILERGVGRGDRRRSSGRSSLVPPRALRPTGLVLVDKPAGPSSFAVVERLRDRTGARAGHAGTLDPFATGLLLVLLGSATRLAQYLVGLDKRYVTEVDLRSRPSTGDVEGDQDDEHEPPTLEELDERLEPFSGEVMLRVPPPRR